MKKVLLLTVSLLAIQATAQQKVMTKELLWQLGRVSPQGLSNDGKYVYYKVSTPDVQNLSSTTTYWITSVDGKKFQKLDEFPKNIADKNISPDGKFQIQV